MLQLLPNIRPVFSEVLSSYYKYHSDKTASKDVMASIMAATVAEITSEIKKVILLEDIVKWPLIQTYTQWVGQRAAKLFIVTSECDHYDPLVRELRFDWSCVIDEWVITEARWCLLQYVQEACKWISNYRMENLSEEIPSPNYHHWLAFC